MRRRPPGGVIQRRFQRGIDDKTRTAIVFTGPFAWNGFVSFWVRNIAITAWITVMAVVLWRAMGRDHQDAGVMA